MPDGFLCYTKGDAAKNSWMIRHLTERAQHEGLRLRLVFAEDLAKDVGSPKFVFQRSRRGDLSQKWENQGARVLNSAQVTGITNDKYATFCYLNKQNIPTVESILFDDLTNLPDEKNPPFLPLIAKPLDGHGGVGVELVNTLDKWAEICRKKPRPFLAQPVMTVGYDLRVYVLFGQPYAAILRTSQRDFRSNFSLGGQVRAVATPADCKAMIAKLQQTMPMDFCGVDFLKDGQGNLKIGEIEDAVGCRMLYQETNLDIVRDFVAMAAKEIKK